MKGDEVVELPKEDADSVLLRLIGHCRFHLNKRSNCKSWLCRLTRILA